MVTRLGGVRWLVLSTLVAGSACVVGCGSDDSTGGDNADAGDAAPDALGDARTDARVNPGTPDASTDGTVPDGSNPDTGSTTPEGGNPDGGLDATTDGPGTGSATAAFAITPIDFGLSDCGGAAATKTLSIQNTGGAALTVTASTTGSFTATPTVTVPGGGTGTLTLSATVPSTATAGTALTGVLTVMTNDSTKASTNVNLSVTPQGAMLVYATGSGTSAAFGTAKINATAPNLTLTLKNGGNKAAAFSFSAPADAQFSLATAPASPATLNANDSVTVTAGFKPTTLASSTSQSAIAVTGAVCAGSTGSIAFSGQGSSGVVTGWPTAALDFGSGTCGGAAPAAKTFTLTNTGGVDVTLTSVGFAGNVGYTTDLTVGKKVPAGGSLIVKVTPPAIPSPSILPGNYGDTLTVGTDIAGDTAHAVSLTEKAQGAILAFDTSATANFGAFGAVSVGSTASQPFNIVNTGSGPATVALTTTGPFGVNTASVTVAAGTNAGDAVTFAPAGITAQTGSLAISPAAGICQPLPAPIALAGTGLNGGILLSGTSLSFTGACGNTALAQSFTIKNNGNVPTAWMGTLGKSGAAAVFTVDSTGSTLQPGDTVTVTVTPKPIPATPATIAPSAFSDTFTIAAPTVVGGQDQIITLSQVPYGAVLKVTPTALPFGNVPINTRSPVQAFTITNSGNLGSPTPTVAVTSGNPALFPLDTGTLSVPAGGNASTNVAFVPGAVAAPQASTVAITAGGPLCAPLPAAVNVTGIGTSGPVLTDGGPFTFGGVNCGATAAAQHRDILNGGPTDFHVTSITLGKGAASPFTLTFVPASLLVAANGQGVTYTITPKPIPAAVVAADLVAGVTTYNDTLTFTTDAPNDVLSHSIPLNMNAQGVILSPFAPKTVDFGTVPLGGQRTLTTPVQNQGNLPVSFVLNLDDGGDPVYRQVFVLPPAQSTIAPATTSSLGLVFKPLTASRVYTVTGSLAVSSTTVLCQPVPASYSGITFSGTSQ